MPTAWITVAAGDRNFSEEQRQTLRDIIAKNMSSGARYLDRNHIALRFTEGSRAAMLAGVEIEVSAQFFVRRHLNRDRRAEAISRAASRLLGVSCATWINLAIVGYSRVTVDGKAYFSDRASGAKQSLE